MIAARVEADGDRFYEPVGGVLETSEAAGIGYSCHSNEMGERRRCRATLVLCDIVWERIRTVEFQRQMCDA